MRGGVLRFEKAMQAEKEKWMELVAKEPLSITVSFLIWRHVATLIYSCACMRHSAVQKLHRNSRSVRGFWYAVADEAADSV